MKSFLKVFSLATLLLTTSIPKSHAIVGLMTWNPSVVAMGGLSIVGVLTGVLLCDGCVDVDIENTNVIDLMGGLALGFGIILMSESQEAELQFTPIKSLKNFSSAEVAIYNQEVEELNAIRQSIQAQLSEDSTVEESKKLWEEHSSFLSPETLRVAAQLSQLALKKK